MASKNSWTTVEFVVDCLKTYSDRLPSKWFYFFPNGGIG